jgi:hypothetical protein
MRAAADRMRNGPPAAGDVDKAEGTGRPALRRPPRDRLPASPEELRSVTASARSLIRVATNIDDLINTHPERITVQHVRIAGIADCWRTSRILWRQDAVLMRMPGLLECLLCLMAKALSPSIRLVYYDLILPPPPVGGWRRLKRRLYFSLLRQADLILNAHADATGYARELRLPAARFRYVGFKSNAWEDTAAVDRGAETADCGSYVLACGRSRRDYATFVKAMALAGVPARILLGAPRALADHGAIPPPEPLPGNVSVEAHDGGRRQWLEALLGARIVVVPLCADAAAGISVYLEAMNLSRPVIVTDGPTTRWMLDDTTAGIVPPADAAVLAAETRRLWQDEALRRRRIAAGRRYVARLGGVERMSRDVLAACLAACDPAGEGQPAAAQVEGRPLHADPAGRRHPGPAGTEAGP